MNGQSNTKSRMHRKRNLQWALHVVVVAVLSLELLSFYMMMQISVKDNTTFIQNPWLPPNPWIPGQTAGAKVDTSAWHWSNYDYGIRLITPYVANTVFVAVLSAGGTLFLSLMGAYFFARYRMPLSGLLWSFFIFLMLMPGIANIVPLFSLLKTLNLLNTLWALVIVHIAGGQAFNLFVLRNFIEDIPKDLFEAAEVDGAGHFRQLMHIVVPMSGSILGTLAIFIFIGSWNEYLLPLIVLRDRELFTIGVGLIYLDGEYVKQWGLIMASFFVASVPLIIIFLFTMKLFIRGLSSGAVKG